MLNLLSRVIYITIVIIAFISIYEVYSPLNLNDYQRVLKKNEIIIGIRTGPASYYEIKNEKTGFTYDLAKELSKFLNVKLKLITVDNIEDATNDLNEEK